VFTPVFSTSASFVSHFKPIFVSGSAKDLSMEVSIHFLPSEHLTTALMAPLWLCLALVLVCLSVHTSSPSCSSTRSWPALIRVFILPQVCQQSRRDSAADPSCAFPSRMPMADKSPTSSGECASHSLSPFHPHLYIVHPLSSLSVHFLFLFSFLLKQKKKSRPLIMICLS